MRVRKWSIWKLTSKIRLGWEWLLVTYLSDAPCAMACALLAKALPVWKYLPETNAQAYSAGALMMTEKSFARAVFERKEWRIFKKMEINFCFCWNEIKKWFLNGATTFVISNIWPNANCLLLNGLRLLLLLIIWHLMWWHFRLLQLRRT